MAELAGHPLGDILPHYDPLERKMLDNYFDFVRQHQERDWLHWNMRDVNYGFAAIEHRYRVLGGDPVLLHGSKKHDLARLLVDIFGVTYAGHPRLEHLVDKNSISRLAFMSGGAEAAAFDNHDYVALHQSTLRKVDILSNILGRTYDGSLKTDATWWEIHGGSVKGFVDWLAVHPIFTITVGIAAVLGCAAGIVALFH
jgi:hypothetical protein